MAGPHLTWLELVIRLRCINVHSTRPQAIGVVFPVLRNHEDESVAGGDSVADEGQKSSILIVGRREERAYVPGVPEKRAREFHGCIGANHLSFISEVPDESQA